PAEVCTLSLHDALPIFGFLGRDDRALRELQRVGPAPRAIVELGEITERGRTGASVFRRVGGLERLAQDAGAALSVAEPRVKAPEDRKSTRLHSSHDQIS